MINLKKHIVGVFLAVILCFLGLMALPSAILAADEPITCTVTYQFADGTVVSGAAFRLYRVADVGADLSFTPVKAFEKYAVNLNDLDSAGLKAAAETLSGYVARDKIAATDSGVTDEAGSLKFPTTATALVKGLYLLCGDSAEINGKIYTVEPILIALPYQDEDADWVYDVTVTPKIAERTDDDSLSVVKVWKDGKTSRPAKIEVQLLKDGEIYETVELNKGNSWRHTWQNLPAGCDWQITEKEVPAGYTVTVSREKTTFTVKNSVPGSPGKTPPGKLPQTGMLWWPIPMLAAVGLLLFMLGVLRHRKNNE